MKIKLMAAIAICVCFASTIHAQDANTIFGKVIDNTGAAIEQAVATLHALPDSSLVKATNTDSTGNFSFTQLKYGRYYTEVTMAGYTTYASGMLLIDDKHLNADLSTIKLAATATGLKEVSVVTKKAFVVRKADRTVVNVDAVITAAGTNALEILEKCPGVQVDQDGGISLKGKQGVTVFINDKPSYLSGADLANYLKSLPSSTLDQIELMTNPPAQYDAAGSAGIINIKIKRKGIKGFNGSMNVNYMQGKLARSNNSLNLNYRNNKVSAYFNAGYNVGNSFTDLTLNRTYKDAANNPSSYFNQASYFKRVGDAVTFNTGVDYSYSEKSVLGIALSGMASKNSSVNDNTSTILNTAQQQDSVIVARNRNETKFTNSGINLNYRTQLNNNGQQITADADYIVYDTHGEQQFNNTTYMPGGPASPVDMLTGHLPNHINIYALKTDYTLPIAKHFKFDAGLKASYTTTDNTAGYTDTWNNITQPDYDKSNRFTYKEHINAAYMNLSREGIHFSLQLGLRVENTSSDGHQLGNLMKPDSSFTRNYTNAFPTAYLTYKFDTDAHNQVGLNYGRRINRPYYEDLNPFINPMDKFTYYVGNPYLRPSFTNSIELSHTYKNKITTALAYSKSADDVNETIEILNGIYYSRPGNIGSKQTITLSLDGDFDPAKWLNVHLYTEAGNINSKSELYGGTLNSSGTYWYGALTLRAKLGKGWDGELNGNYRTKITDAQFVIGNLGQANIGFQKKVSKTVTLKLNANDLFYTRIVRGQINDLAQATANWINKSDTRYISLSFNWRFGQVLRNIEKHSSGADSEQQRVKG